MTREEMEELKWLAASMGLYDDKNPCKRAVILGKAIKELEHEEEIIDALGLSLHVQSLRNSILEEEKHKLDKITAEINAMFPPSGAWMYEEGHEVEHAVCEVLFDVLQIIDKYRGKQNG